MSAPHQTTGPLRALRSGLILSAVLASTLHAQQPPVLVHMSHFTPHQVRVEVFSVATPQNVRLNVTGADERFPQHGKLAVLERVFGGSATSGDGEDAWRGNAWIINANTRNLVWELRNAATHRDKDGVRTFDGTVHLDPGTYEVYFASYSSYSSTVNIRSNEHLTPAQISARTRYEDDGISRKFDLTVRGAGSTAPASAYVADVDAARRSGFVSLTGLHSNESRSAGFELDRPTRIDVYAIGEVRETETFDYGWIINADTHQKVWGLDFANSHPAGGARKNREANAHLTLPAGRYAAIYTLDDSHDLSNWNTSPPHDPAMWGMTLRLADQADRSHVKIFDYSPKVKNAIVAMTGLGDGESRSTGFTISRPVNVHVYALGEGDRADMSDYGWITDAKTHKRVWTMQYSNTQHAGGSAKNRVASQVLHLEPGSYIAGFRTDESHSAKEWNAGAPIDGSMWGISIWPDRNADRSAVSAYDPSRDEGVVVAKLVNMADDEDARSTFHVDKPGSFRVYAIGEGRDNQMFDRGMIEERGTHRVVWQMSYDKTVPAGGSAKNRLFDGMVQLPAGDYVLRWTSDDSHSYNNWNDTAPEDPSHWGITLYRPSGK